MNIKSFLKLVGICMIAYVALIAFNAISGTIGFTEVGIAVTGLALAAI